MQRIYIKFIGLSLIFCLSFVQAFSDCESEWNDCSSDAWFALQYDLNWGCDDSPQPAQCEQDAYREYFFNLGVCESIYVRCIYE